MKRRLAITVLAIGMVASFTSWTAAQDEIVIATWNIANFAPDKLAEKIDALVYLIEEHGIDILALQEATNNTVSGNTPLATYLIPRLGGVEQFGLVVGYLGDGDKLAVIYNRSTIASVSCNTESDGCVFELAEVSLPGQGINRPALVLDIETIGGFDFTLLNIHPKPGESPDDEGTRERQFALVAEWILKELTEGQNWSNPDDNDYDIILVGDFNEHIVAGEDNDEGRLDLLEWLLSFNPVTVGTYISTATRIIDHIACSRVPGGAVEEIKKLPKVLVLYDEAKFISSVGQYTREAFKIRISDHLPVMAVFYDVDRD